jgi:hypothetical protein
MLTVQEWTQLLSPFQPIVDEMRKQLQANEKSITVLPKNDFSRQYDIMDGNSRTLISSGHVIIGIDFEKCTVRKDMIPYELYRAKCWISGYPVKLADAKGLNNYLEEIPNLANHQKINNEIEKNYPAIRKEMKERYMVEFEKGLDSVINKARKFPNQDAIHVALRLTYRVLDFDDRTKILSKMKMVLEEADYSVFEKTIAVLTPAPLTVEQVNAAVEKLKNIYKS